MDSPIFWNEEKQVSELRWGGYVFTGTFEGTAALHHALMAVDEYRKAVGDYLVKTAAMPDVLLQKLSAIARPLDVVR